MTKKAQQDQRNSVQRTSYNEKRANRRLPSGVAGPPSRYAKFERLRAAHEPAAEIARALPYSSQPPLFACGFVNSSLVPAPSARQRRQSEGLSPVAGTSEAFRRSPSRPEPDESRTPRRDSSGADIQERPRQKDLGVPRGAPGEQVNRTGLTAKSEGRLRVRGAGVAAVFVRTYECGTALSCPGVRATRRFRQLSVLSLVRGNATGDVWTAR